MSELTLLILRLVFLLLLWVFVFMIVYALRSDLFGQRARRMAAPVTASIAPAAPTSAVTEPVAPQRAAPAADTTTPSRLVITGGPREGMQIDLPAEQLTIGRSQRIRPRDP